MSLSAVVGGRPLSLEFYHLRVNPSNDDRVCSGVFQVDQNDSELESDASEISIAYFPGSLPVVPLRAWREITLWTIEVAAIVSLR
jgi:hypothetical protein